jgi:hypothetical protein
MGVLFMSSKLFNQFQCSSMMLAEHIEALGKHRQERDRSHELHIPEIDQQQYEEWERLLKKSLDYRTSIFISYIYNSRRVMTKGYVKQINVTNKTIILQTPAKTKTIAANKIIFIKAA